MILSEAVARTVDSDEEDADDDVPADDEREEEFEVLLRIFSLSLLLISDFLGFFSYRMILDPIQFGLFSLLLARVIYLNVVFLLYCHII